MKRHEKHQPMTERERLIRTGMAIELAWSQEGRTPTREEIESAKEDVAAL